MNIVIHRSHLEVTMTTLIKIGNSQGVRIPKAIIEQAHLIDKNLEFKKDSDFQPGFNAISKENKD